MKFHHPTADVLVPDGRPAEEAIARVTHLAIGAHQDDLEILAHQAIAYCINNQDTSAFGGVVVTDGAGSSRTGPYAAKTNEEMKAIRREEQRQAARLGQYAIQVQLDYPSAAVKSEAAGQDVEDDLYQILTAARPEEVIIHNPADKHDTHVGLFLRCLGALRRLSPEQRPTRVLGAEVWRGLDWMLNEDKVALDDSALPELRQQLLAAFDSQITGGKRYDEAVEGRRAANATFHDSHSSDEANRLTWAMDLTPLVTAPTMPVAEFISAKIDRLKADVVGRIDRMS